MVSTISASEFEEICRVCMRLTIKLTPITLHNVIEMIQACTSIKIFQNDHLPKQICENCLSQLQSAFGFKVLCENSDKELRRIYEKYCNDQKVEKIKTENIDTDDIKREPEVKTENQYEDDELANVENITGYDNKNEDSSDEINSKSNNADTKILTKHKKTGRKRGYTKSSCGKKFQCELCKHAFDSVGRLGVHMKRTHSAEGIKCSKCDVICYHQLHLEAHERFHLEKFMKKFKCNVCNRSFARKEQLKRHYIVHSKDRSYQCTICYNFFKTKCVLKAHIKKIHISPDPHEVCQICGKSVVKSSLKLHLTTHSQQRPTFPCTECPQKFYSKANLQKHFRRVHQNEAIQYRYLCNICGRGVLSNADLERHLLTHSEERTFQCPNCDKKYRGKDGLRRHIKSRHLDERPYSCSVCSRAFHTKAILRNHMRKHTGERPFHCTICGKSFGFKAAQQTHMKMHTS